MYARVLERTIRKRTCMNTRVLSFEPMLARARAQPRRCKLIAKARSHQGFRLWKKSAQHSFFIVHSGNKENWADCLK